MRPQVAFDECTHNESKSFVLLGEWTRHALERSYLRPSYRMREKIVRRLESSRVGRSMLKAYRLGRGRSSRSA